MTTPGYYKVNYRALSHTNTRSRFDSLPEHKVVWNPSGDVRTIYQAFRKHLERYPQTPRQFPDNASLQRWFDTNQTQVFDERVRRGLFTRMSDAEVALARRQLPPPLPTALLRINLPRIPVPGSSPIGAIDNSPGQASPRAPPWVTAPQYSFSLSPRGTSGERVGVRGFPNGPKPARPQKYTTDASQPPPQTLQPGGLADSSRRSQRSADLR